MFYFDEELQEWVDDESGEVPLPPREELKYRNEPPSPPSFGRSGKYVMGKLPNDYVPEERPQTGLSIPSMLDPKDYGDPLAGSGPYDPETSAMITGYGKNLMLRKAGKEQPWLLPGGDMAPPEYVQDIEKTMGELDRGEMSETQLGEKIKANEFGGRIPPRPDPTKLSLSEYFRSQGPEIAGRVKARVDEAGKLFDSQFAGTDKALLGPKERFQMEKDRADHVARAAEAALSHEKEIAKQDWLKIQKKEETSLNYDKDIQKYITLNPGMKDKIGTPEFKRGYEEHVRTMAGAKSAISEEAKEEIAQSLAKGELTRIRDVVSLRATAGGAAIEIFNRARQINPNFSTAEIDRKIKTEEAFTVGKDGQNIQSFGTFLEHAGAAKEAVTAINNTNPPLVNKPVNWWKKNMNADPNFQAFIVSLEPVRKEFEGFLLGGRALYGDDRKNAEIILNDNSSLAQVEAALKQMGHTAKARFNEANHRYKRVMKQDIPDPFSEEALQGASRIGVDLLGKGKPNVGGNAPPAHLLKEGFATPFGSKGTWTLKKGVPTRVD